MSTNTVASLRIDVPEGPARAALMRVYRDLACGIAVLQREARYLQVAAANRARLILSGAGHELDMRRARALRVVDGGAAVIVDLMPEGEGGGDAEHNAGVKSGNNETPRDADQIPSTPRVPRGRKRKSSNA